MDNKLIFSNNLKLVMAVHEKSQTDLMNDLGLSSATVSSWVNGFRLPRMDKVKMLADYFGIKPHVLLEEKEIDITTSLPMQNSDIQKQIISNHFQFDEINKLSQLHQYTDHELFAISKFTGELLKKYSQLLKELSDVDIGMNEENKKFLGILESYGGFEDHDILQSVYKYKKILLSIFLERHIKELTECAANFIDKIIESELNHKNDSKSDKTIFSETNK